MPFINIAGYVFSGKRQEQFDSKLWDLPMRVAALLCCLVPVMLPRHQAQFLLFKSSLEFIRVLLKIIPNFVASLVGCHRVAMPRHLLARVRVIRDMISHDMLIVNMHSLANIHLLQPPVLEKTRGVREIRS
jgi:hypothetical protein